MTAFVSAPMSSGADARARVERRLWRWPLIFVVLLGWTLLVNWPVLRLEDADDGFFLEVAHLWTRGFPPYVASFDIKGPGFFAALALALKVFAPTLTTLKLMGVAGSAVAATLLFSITERLGRPVAILCAAAYPILLVVNGDAAYCVMNAFLLTAYALALGERRGLGPALGAGLAVGVACAFKQTCAIDALAVLYFLLARGERSPVRTTLAFGASAALAPLAFLAYFAAIGATGVFLDDVVWTALARSDGVSLAVALRALLEWMMPLSVVVVALAGALLNLRAIEERKPVRAFAIWLAFAFASLALQRAGYRTYVVPMIAPMLALGAAYVDHVCRGLTPGRRNAVFGAFGASIFAGALFGHGAAMLRKLPVVDDQALGLMSASLQNAHASPADRLLVLNGAPWLNLVTDLRPPTAVFHPGHFQCDFPGAGEPALWAALAAKPRFVMLENPSRRPVCESQATADAIEAGLAAGYRVVDSGGAANTAYRLYEVRR